MIEAGEAARTWQLVPRQPEGVPDDLLVHHSPDLKENLVDGDSGRPVIERALSFTHSHLCARIGQRARLGRGADTIILPRYR